MSFLGATLTLTGVRRRTPPKLSDCMPHTSQRSQDHNLCDPPRTQGDPGTHPGPNVVAQRNSFSTTNAVTGGDLAGRVQRPPADALCAVFLAYLRAPRACGDCDREREEDYDSEREEVCAVP